MAAPSVYQNVIAWRNALATVDIDLSVWRIHRRIGMSGGLVDLRAAAGDRPDPVRRRDRGGPAGAQRRVPGPDRVGPPAARRRRLLAALTGLWVPWAIATSGRHNVASMRCRCWGCPTIRR